MSARDNERRYHSLIMMPTVQGKHDGVRLALYKRIWEYLSSGYAVIYVVEPDPSKVIREMSEVGAELGLAGKKEIENHISSGAFVVSDRDKFYLSSKTNHLDTYNLMDSWNSLVLKVQKKSKPKGIIAIGGPSIYLEINHHWTNLAQYERAIGKGFAKPVEAICWYNNPKIVAKLSFSNLVTLINAHHSTIHNGWSYREWRPYDIIAKVEEGMDRMLGKGTTRLIFKTLKLVYEKDPERTIIFQPEVFEEKLTKIMGSSVSKLLFEVLADALRKEVSFDRMAQVH